MKTVSKGSVYIFDDSRKPDKERMCLVVSSNERNHEDKMCNVLFVVDSCYGRNVRDIVVDGDYKMVNCACITYAMKEYLTEYVDHIDGDVMEDIEDGILDTLGLKDVVMEGEIYREQYENLLEKVIANQGDAYGS